MALIWVKPCKYEKYHIFSDNLVENMPLGLVAMDSIYADKDRLNQVLLNLYLNAIQSMEDSGRLHVKLFRDRSARRLVDRPFPPG